MSNISQEQLNKWELELIKCRSEKQLRAYVEKYKGEIDNPYVEEALKCLTEERFFSKKTSSSENATGKSKYSGFSFNLDDIVKGVLFICVIGLGAYVCVSWRDWLPKPKPSPLPKIIQTVPISPVKHETEHSSKRVAPNHDDVTSYEEEWVTENVWVECWDCLGSGRCRYCKGEGWDFVTNGSGEIISAQECVNCHGGGRCQVCCGSKGHYEMQTRRRR